MLGFHLSQPVEAVGAARLVVDVEREEACLFARGQANGGIWPIRPPSLNDPRKARRAFEAIGRQRRLFAKRDDLAGCLVDVLLGMRTAGEHGPALGDVMLR